MILEILTYIFIAIFGLCIGSFLNCVIYRMEYKKSLNGWSFCPHCKHNLSWLDLFPVFSWLFLKGRCRYCKKKISWQYPVVEISTALLFLIILNFKFEILNQFEILKFLNPIFLFYIAGSLVVIFVYDLKHYLIPDKVLFPAIIITFLYRLFGVLWIPAFAGMTRGGAGMTGSKIIFLENYLLATVVAGGFFLLIFLISKGRAMGFGDVKLAVLMGLLLGLPNVLVALFLAFFIGAIICVILMAFQKKGLKSEIPFGPFLILGTFIALFWGEQIIQWYFTFFKI